MLESFRVTGRVFEIGDIIDVNTSNDEKVKLISFIITYIFRNKEYFIKFDLFGKDRINRFLLFSDIGKDITVFFTINAKEHEGSYYNNLRVSSFWIPKINRNFNEPPIFPINKFNDE